ncbi:MAG: SPFH domain-containing protein [Firmicutes bacterium]|nr:SPFH domain-containing protein [Bacillota bacterium]MCL5039960.1 SPFH domain-containing protein [Bacillota bacterium]
MLNINIVIVAALIVVGTLVILTLLMSMFRKVGPNRALIVYGFGGTHVVRGGGTLVWPLIQNAQELSLELMSFDVAPNQDLYTVQGVSVTVEAVTQIKVKSDPESILTAAEQFLTKTFDERQGMIRLVMEGHLRGIVGQLTVEQIVKQPEMVSEKLRMTCAEDLAKMGLDVVSFTIKEVKDKNQYIENMGKPDIAVIKKVADIAAAEAERDTAIRRAQAGRESAVAKAQADQERIIAETASLTRQAEAQRDLELKKAAYQADVQKAKAQADKAYEIQTNVMQQQVIAEQVKIDRIRKEEEVKVQEAEILRRERELAATVLKPAEMEKRKIEAMAEAQRQKLTLEAQGRAEALRVEGQADADVIRLKGTAEAEIILSKGRSEAEAMQVKAEAYLAYNQAAILDKMLSGLPELARAMAEPLAKVDRITVVSTDGAASGVNRVMADVAKAVAEGPALVETLTGMKLGDLLRTLPTVSQGKGKPPEGEAKKGTPQPGR